MGKRRVITFRIQLWSQVPNEELFKFHHLPLLQELFGITSYISVISNLRLRVDDLLECWSLKPGRTGDKDTSLTAIPYIWTNWKMYQMHQKVLNFSLPSAYWSSLFLCKNNIRICIISTFVGNKVW